MKKILIITQCALAVSLAVGSASAADQTAAAMESLSAMESQSAPAARPSSVFYGSAKKPGGSAGKESKGEGEKDGKESKAEKGGGEKVGKESKAEEDGVSNIGIPATVVDEEYGGQVAMPEVTQRAILSRSDVNRIVCPTPIRDVNYSEEKGVLVKIAGNNAFVKFRAEKVDGKVSYTKMPVELFVSCGDAVYNLVAIPKAVPSQTIRMESGKVAKAKENIALFKEQTIKKKVVGLIKRAYTDDLPESFTVTAENRTINLFHNIGIVHRRTIAVDGEGLVLKEYQVSPTMDGVEFEEKSFIRREISENPIAVAFDKLKVAKGEKARLFVVEVKSSLTEVIDAE